MSSRRLLLDGPDLPELIRRAETAGGRVVRAVRLRKGLLQRRWYQVTVEIRHQPSNVVTLTPRGTAVRPPVAAPTTRGATAVQPGAAGLNDLLAAAEAAERYDTAVSRTARQSRAASSRKGRGR